jgi:hypothetical protein
MTKCLKGTIKIVRMAKTGVTLMLHTRKGFIMGVALRSY